MQTAKCNRSLHKGPPKEDIWKFDCQTHEKWESATCLNEVTLKCKKVDYLWEQQSGTVSDGGSIIWDYISIKSGNILMSYD